MAEIENQFERILTERLLLRRPVSTDLDAVYEIHSDPVTNKFNPAGPDPDLAASKQRLQEWLNRRADLDRHDGTGHAVILVTD